MEGLPELPDMKEDYPLEVQGKEPFQYSLDGLEPLPGVTEAQLSDTSLPFSPAPEYHDDYPPLGSGPSSEAEVPALPDLPSPDYSDGPPQLDSLPQLSAESPSSPDSQLLGDIHGELKSLARHLKEQKGEPTPRNPRQLSQDFHFRLGQ